MPMTVMSDSNLEGFRDFPKITLFLIKKISKISQTTEECREAHSNEKQT